MSPPDSGADIHADTQRLNPGTIVSLYTLDATAQGGAVLRFSAGSGGGSEAREAVVYQGHRYLPLPVAVSGLKQDGAGPAARPTLKISAVNAATTATLLGMDNLRGAQLTRVRTLARYLDGAAEADPTRHWPPEIYRVEALMSRTKTELSWRLASPLDYDRKKLPGRQILRDVCAWSYRRWDGKAFDYSEVLCPYVGDRYFNARDQAVSDPAKDRCSRRLSGCRARYSHRLTFSNGQQVQRIDPLPFGGFPGVGRLQV